jgi:uncharacterized delta-60 repeat protein
MVTFPNNFFTTHPRASQAARGMLQQFMTGPMVRLFTTLALLAGATLGAPPPLTLAAPAWSTTGSMGTARYVHTATLLSNGKVLIVGGEGDNGPLSSTEVYDPATGTWSPTGNLGTAHYGHTATLLPNGKVLVSGGEDDSGPLSSAEVYDPATGTWSPIGNLGTAHYGHTATLLPNGKVLVAGGYGNSGYLSSAEVYDAATGTWSPTTESLSTARYFHTATLLPDGKVLVVGGYGVNGVLSSSEVYDPAMGTWSPTTGSLGMARYLHTATLLPSGKVLVAGGIGGSGVLSSSEVYDPMTEMWSPTTGSLGTEQYGHTATLLPNGRVLVAGGYDARGGWLSSTESYDLATGMWSSIGSLGTARYDHTATLLPNGKVLVVGGWNSSGPLSSAEVYEAATGTWTSTGSLGTGREYHTATLLPNGKVLVVGGDDGGSGGPLSSAELYDPAMGTWSPTEGSLGKGHYRHTATLLPNGKVLVVGGWVGIHLSSSAELYDATAGTWTTTGSMSTARYMHTATLLPNGKVLVAGGEDNSSHILSSAELYDATAGTWTTTGSMSTARYMHTATLLPNGKVLVAGGGSSSAEVYDPATGTWSTTGSLGTGSHTATLLPDGRVLVAGGEDDSGTLSSAEVYDPVTGMWTPTGSMGTARVGHTATLLPNGKVLVAGGYGISSYLTSAELYDPATGLWSATESLHIAREGHTATLLPNGKVLVVGGWAGGGPLSSTELYDMGLGFMPTWQPTLSTVTSPITVGQAITATGTGWRGYGHTEASGGGYNSSATNYPLVQLYRLDNAQTLWLPTSIFTETALTTLPLSGYAAGHSLATVFVNGIPSAAQIIRVDPTYYTTTVKTVGIGSGAVNSTPPGIDCGTFCAASYLYSTVVTLMATPDISSTFTGWSGDCSGTGNCVVTMTTDQNVTATFALNTYTITPTAGVGGSITPDMPQTVRYGESMTFTIAPDANYHIVDVGVDGVSVGAVDVYTFTNVTADHSIIAAFALPTYVITPTAGANGSIAPDMPQTVSYGESITFTIAPDVGYHIVDMGVDSVSHGALTSYTFNNVTADHTLTATFAINTYAITPTAGMNGAIIPGTPQTVNYGESITFTIAPDTNYHIVDVGVDGVSHGALTSYTFDNVSADHTLTATFAVDVYTLTVATTGTGSGVITPTVGTHSYVAGTIVTLTAVANSYSMFTGWSGDADCADGLVTMNANQVCTATFATFKLFLPLILR